MSMIKTQSDQSIFLVVTDKNTKFNKLVTSPNPFQVGLKDFPSDLTVTGKISSKGELCLSVRQYKANSVVDKSTSVALILGGGNVSLPKDVSDGHYLCVKDADGSASVNPIIISSSSGDKIDGGTTVGISTNYGSKVFSWYKNQWFLVSST